LKPFSRRPASRRFVHDVGYPRGQAYCGQRMAMNWNTPSIFPYSIREFTAL
jgi:hypothetical protein